MERNGKVIYREVQRPRQIWFWAIVILVTVFSWYSFIQQIIFGIPVGNQPAPDFMMILFWILFGILFPILMVGFMRLTTEVHEDGIYVRYLPFHYHYRKFSFHDIEKVEPIVYSFYEFGGWGVRTNMKGETVYSMSGKDGIRLHLKNQIIVIIGTKRQEEMLSAIRSQRPI